ncbi:two-component system, sensor histidine kinase RegB [Roseovarius litoreus]|uniref:histidine kinase n=1 Tax=Roseovarius litoreus TaxID=1155722 RepID=A0A1M7BGY0_9RHOB|nr:ActS/PrrB/RegB family redox-sensitive histidine kinase [Roseovarius litoreus]SHL54298.1 two-component system, sensor histidine kinase RegB [Roseovarius litoreus]
MSDISPSAFKSRSRGNWIRLRTLILLRWWAIAGQVTALIVAQQLYNLNLEIGLCYLVVGVAVISNLVASFVYPENKRLSETETLLVVLFDMLQLGLMLYLTGGLNNPFSILIVGPVTVSASALSSRSTLFLGLMAILIVSILTQFHLPLRTEQGFILRMPDVFLFGNWAAIVIAIVFLGVYSRWIVSEMDAMSNALQATQMALAREQKLTDLGGVVAAAAHELGTPLATIKLTSSELAQELSDNEELRQDAVLISEQADRCRDILRSMGRAGKDDLHLRKAPLTALIEEAADPHMDRGKTIHFEHVSSSGPLDSQPTIHRRPEVIHGLRNLIQNAVDFARGNVWIESRWSETHISLRIMDDGRGYPQHVMARIGEPFMRRRGPVSDPRRPGYEGMGLGLFIAKTLLERSGADLSFANATDAQKDGAAGHPDRTGAVVEVTWPRHRMEDETSDSRQPTGDNPPIRA